MAPMGDVAIISQAIQNLVSLPDAARNMLLQALPHACEGIAEHKDEMQKRFLTLIGSNVQQSKSACMEEGAKCQEAMAATTMRLEQCQEAVKAAAEGVCAADAIVTARTEERDAARATAQKSAQQHSNAEVKAQRSFSAWQQLRDDFQLAEEAGSAARGLAEGSFEQGEVVACVAQLEAFLAGSRAEQVLIVAAKVALALAVESRSSFDKMTVQHVVEVVEAQHVARRQAVADIEQQEAELKAETLGIWAIMEVDGEAEQDACSSLAEAEAARWAAQKALDRANKEETAAQKTICEHNIQIVLLEVSSKQADDALEAIDRVIAGTPAASAEDVTGRVAELAEHAPEPPCAADADMQDAGTVVAKLQHIELPHLEVACAGA